MKRHNPTECETPIWHGNSDVICRRKQQPSNNEEEAKSRKEELEVCRSEMNNFEREREGECDISLYVMK